MIAKLPMIVARLTGILDRGARTLQWMDPAFLATRARSLPAGSKVGKTRVVASTSDRGRMRYGAGCHRGAGPGAARLHGGGLGREGPGDRRAGPAGPTGRARPPTT